MEFFISYSLNILYNNDLGQYILFFFLGGGLSPPVKLHHKNIVACLNSSQAIYKCPNC